ncbi:MAG: M24 family metallopeptidase, partial [bacterium]
SEWVPRILGWLAEKALSWLAPWILPALAAAWAMGRDRLEAGMVITVEPGVYIPGWGGIRIEDVVAVTPSGCERLTHASRAP